MFIPVFALNKGSSLYHEADFDTHAFQRQVPEQTFTKNPQPTIMMKETQFKQN